MMKLDWKIVCNMITLLVILSGLLVISFGINIVKFILIRRLLQKINIYQTWIIKSRDNVKNTLNVMREIDNQGMFASSFSEKGLFESDDSVGQIFKQLLEIVNELNTKIQE